MSFYDKVKQMLSEKRGSVGQGIGQMVGALIFALVGLALTPTIANEATAAAANANVSAGAAAMIRLVPLLYVVLILGGVVGYLYFTFKKGQ